MHTKALRNFTKQQVSSSLTTILFLPIDLKSAYISHKPGHTKHLNKNKVHFKKVTAGLPHPTVTSTKLTFI